MHARTRPDEVEEPRHDVHDHLAVAESPHDLHRPRIGLAAEGDDDPVGIVKLHERGETVEATERLDAVDVCTLALRVGVDEAEQLEPVLGVLLDLPGNELSDVTAADHDHTLVVARQPTSEPTCNRTTEGDQRDCQKPIHREALHLGRREPRDHGRRRHEPRAERDHLQDAEQLVDGGVIGALLVPIVEPVQLEEQNPDGERQREEERLGNERDRRGIADSDECRRKDECDDHTCHVGDDERTSDGPSTEPTDFRLTELRDRRRERHAHAHRRRRRLGDPASLLATHQLYSPVSFAHSKVRFPHTLHQAGGFDHPRSSVRNLAVRPVFAPPRSRRSISDFAPGRRRRHRAARRPGSRPPPRRRASPGPDPDPTENHRAATDRRTSFDDGGQHRPVVARPGARPRLSLGDACR